jgi:hypothetical protein
MLVPALWRRADRLWCALVNLVSIAASGCEIRLRIEALRYAASAARVLPISKAAWAASRPFSTKCLVKTAM